MNKPLIFISYRKADTMLEAMFLFEKLEAAVGEDLVFLDKEKIEIGDRWDKVLEEKINTAKLVIVLIKDVREWMGYKKKWLFMPTRRIDDKNDWVRKELETALRLKHRIFILRIDDAAFPGPYRLPDSLTELNSIQNYPVRRTHLSLDIDFVIESIKQHLPEKPPKERELPNAQAQQEINKVKDLFSLDHKFTCNRGKQYSSFMSLLRANNGVKTNFLYLFGGEKQRHDGFFRRCVNEARGIDIATGYQVFDYETVKFISMDNLENQYPELVNRVLLQLGLLQIEIDELEEKTLYAGLKKKGILSIAKPGAKLFLHISIAETLWHPEHVPNVTRRFIEEFCLKSLQADAPTIYFFFSMEYDDLNTVVRNQIEQAFKEAKFLSSITQGYAKDLGELGMVKDQDLNEWFSYHSNKWPSIAERDEDKMQKFGDPAPDQYMDTVLINLGSIIEKINIKANNEKRN